MTIADASIKLYQWYFSNDSFCENDFIKLLSISEEPESQRASVLCALEEFEKNGVVKKSSFNGNYYWILSKKFDAYEQNVTISPKTAFIIAEIINSYCTLIENDSERCNPSSVTEKDIKNLLVIFNEMREKIFDKTKKPEQDESVLCLGEQPTGGIPVEHFRDIRPVKRPQSTGSNKSNAISGKGDVPQGEDFEKLKPHFSQKKKLAVRPKTNPTHKDKELK